MSTEGTETPPTGTPDPDEYIEGLVQRKEWDRLTEDQRQFLREAEAGSFGYIAEDGRVFAMGAAKTGNLFTVDYLSEKEPDPDEGYVYWPRSQDED